MATYDQTKSVVLRLLGESDSLLARFVGGLIAGFAGAVVACPFDLLKTRQMLGGAQHGRSVAGPLLERCRSKPTKQAELKHEEEAAL